MHGRLLIDFGYPETGIGFNSPWADFSAFCQLSLSVVPNIMDIDEASSLAKTQFKTISERLWPQWAGSYEHRKRRQAESRERDMQTKWRRGKETDIHTYSQWDIWTREASPVRWCCHNAVICGPVRAFHGDCCLTDVTRDIKTCNHDSFVTAPHRFHIDL